MASQSLQPFFAQLTSVPNTHKQTNRHIDHATCDICSNRPHLCTVCMRRGLITVWKYDHVSHTHTLYRIWSRLFL